MQTVRRAAAKHKETEEREGGGGAPRYPGNRKLLGNDFNCQSV